MRNVREKLVKSPLKKAESAHSQSRRLAGFTGVAALALTTVFNPAVVEVAEAGSKNYIRITAENASIPKQVKLGLNKSIVVDLPSDAHDILVANPDVADAVTRTSRRIYIFGKQIGQTNVFVFDGAGNQTASIEIDIERDIAGLESRLAKLIKNSDIKAEMVNDNIVLTGTVPTPQASAQAAALAEVFVTGGELSPGGNQNRQLSILFGGAPGSQVVNLLKIEGEDQVHLKVTVAEIQRNIVKQLGVTTNLSNNGDDGFGFSTFAGGGFNQAIAGSTGGLLNITHGLNSINQQLNAMEQAGVMRTLAEPSLTAISGKAALFNVGGEYNVAQRVSCTDEGVEVAFTKQEYGISLAFTPVVLTEGRISLQVRTEVNEPTSRSSPSVCQTANLPGLRKRLAETNVELPSGGSMVIAGLIQDDVRQAVNGHPGLKDIPVLGALFRSREFVRDESELVIVVTPYLVRPTARRKLAQPDENFQPASDAAGYFMGRVNRVYGTKRGNLPKGRYTGSIGFILK